MLSTVMTIMNSSKMPNGVLTLLNNQYNPNNLFYII
jgi:hypothetical protein